MSPAATRHILLLSPPSLAANPEAMKVATQSYDLSITDFQMIDRLCAGIASLKLAVYDKIVLLPGADNSLAESLHLIDRTQLLAITKALVPGGVLCTQDHLGGLNNLLDPTLQVEALLAGLLVDAAGNLQLPNYDTQTAVPLRLSSKKSTSNNKDDAAKDSQLAGLKSSAVDGVVMIDPSVDFGDDFGGDNDDDDYDDDDELIDEDDLLDGDFDDADQIVQRKSLSIILNRHLYLPSFPPRPVYCCAKLQQLTKFLHNSSRMPPKARPKTPCL